MFFIGDAGVPGQRVPIEVLQQCSLLFPLNDFLMLLVVFLGIGYFKAGFDVAVGLEGKLEGLGVEDINEEFSSFDEVVGHCCLCYY